MQKLCKSHPAISLNFPPNPGFISPLPYGISHLGSLSGGTAHATNALLAGGGAGRLSLRFPANGRVSSAANGLWIKQPDSMVYVAEMLPDHSLQGIKIWRYGSDFKLTEAVAAQSAAVHADHWLLKNTESSLISDTAVQTKREAERRWPNNISGKLLDILLVKPEQMPLSALTGYIRYLEDNGQQTQEYRVAWWNKLVYPVATVVMALVALAFTPQSGRHTNMGLRLFVGICLGLLFSSPDSSSALPPVSTASPPLSPPPCPP